MSGLKKDGRPEEGRIQTLLERAKDLGREPITAAGQFCRKCGAGRGELGLEPQFDLYIKHLCDIFDEVRRVLKKTGTVWAVLGDTYWSAKGSCHNPGGGANSIETSKKDYGVYPLHRGNKSDIPYLQPKSLCQIPSRFAIEMSNRGWILRNIIIWQKSNCTPSSARDRFTVDFESVYFFAKNRKYYFEKQFEAYADPINCWGGQIPKHVTIKQKKYLKMQKISSSSCMKVNGKLRPNSLGRNKRCVWKIPTRPFPEAHFAVYPEALIEIPLRAGCPEDGIVLDPFIGSGSTGIVAKKLGRNFIGIDTNPKYCEMARKRIAVLQKFECIK